MAWQFPATFTLALEYHKATCSASQSSGRPPAPVKMGDRETADGWGYAPVNTEEGPCASLYKEPVCGVGR